VFIHHLAPRQVALSLPRDIKDFFLSPRSRRRISRRKLLVGDQTKPRIILEQIDSAELKEFSSELMRRYQIFTFEHSNEH
jgi:hypothetical protein